MSKTDFEKPENLTVADLEAFYRNQRELESTNSVRIAGTVLQLETPEIKQKQKKVENNWVPMFDDEGNPLMKNQQYFLTIAFVGGSIRVEISKEWFDSIQIGSMILLDGAKLVDKYGNLKEVFHRYTVLR